ncbi:MAG: hypothetical protein L3K09_05415 [Thermoplasmata archaeon]|nr:hypothetical protein [Thermoplasmata archaeon]
MPAERAAGSPKVESVADALAQLGRPPGSPPSRPVLHGAAGTLVTVGILSGRRAVTYSGAFVSDGVVRLVGPAPPPSGLAETLAAPTDSTRAIVDLLVEATRLYLERVEEVDLKLAATEEHGRSVPLHEVWSLHRDSAGVDAQVGRALVASAELSGPLARSFPGIEKVLPSIVAELERTSALCAQTRQALSDLILLRNAEESNRIATAANELSRTSNRIAALANISNIRMLGLTYVALLLGLVSAVVLIPNTAATILGMPSAGWVPGVWVDAILIVLAVVPVVLVFSRRWVLGMLRGFSSYERRAREGLSDLPELSPDAAADPSDASALAAATPRGPPTAPKP